MEVDEVTYHIDPASVEVWQDVWIAPTGPPAADRIGAPMPDRSFDRETYGRDEWYPREPLAAGPRFCVRGTQGIHLQVFPFRHNPVRGLLEVARRISFSGWNDRLVEGVVAAIWKEFRLTFDPSFKLVGNTAALDKQPRLGAVLEAGKAHMIRMLPSDLELNRVECEEFTLFGDPEMPLLGISIGE